MNLNLLRNKLALVIVLLTGSAITSFSQQDSTKIKVAEDVFVSQQDPSVNKNGETDMGVSIDEKNSDSRETYLKFDISGLSGKGGLVSVDLSMVAAVKKEAPWTLIPHLYINIFGCTKPWSETTLTWNNKVDSDPEIIAEGDITAEGGRYEINGIGADTTTLKKYIETAMKNHQQFVSFVIKGKQETPNSRIWISDMIWEPARLIVVQDVDLDEPGYVVVEAQSLSIASANNATTISVDNGSLQLNAAILPVNADIKRVQWSVLDESGKATISPDGLLTALDNGTVNVIADAIDGSWLRAETVITITGQDYTWAEKNIIVNGDFSSNSTWYGNVNIVDGVGMFAPETVTTNPWDAGVIQEMKLPYDKKDLNYIFSFQIHSDEDRSLLVFMQDHNNDYTKYGISTDAESNGSSWWTIEHVPSTPTFYHFHVNFTNMAVNCSQHLTFGVGSSISPIYVDSVSLMTAEDFASKALTIHNNNLKVYPNPVGAANELTVSLATENERV
ncbi:MAG TPA: DNRLRE domain-containing protein, partial [Prolixibacteraceae bacterium]